VRFKYQHRYAISDELIGKLQVEEEMVKKDEYEQEIDIIRNELETFIFRLQNGLTRDFPEYFDPSKIEEFKGTVSHI
jgi:hypothetical protein